VSQFVYRRALPEDIAACIELRGRTRENAISAERLRSLGITRDSWSRDVAEGTLPGHVCLSGDTIVGYCFGFKATGEIAVLALLPEFESLGIGRDLLGRMVEDLRSLGFHRLFLGCSANPTTRSYGFYRHLGWRATGTFDAHDDEVLEYLPETVAGRAASILFATSDLHAFEIRADDVPDLQRFFDTNPEYFLTVTGAPPGAREAEDEFGGSLPGGWSFGKKWLLGFRNDTGPLVGMANVVSDLLAPRVWHIGLFIVATARHGTGDARTLYQGLESWAMAHGAEWLRLGVVLGNARAEHFWERRGFAQTRTRGPIEMGERVNTVRVMMKALAGGTLAQYLSLIERDRPEAA
jgi:GNAT superfamily N-acetyltransferase